MRTAPAFLCVLALACEPARADGPGPDARSGEPSPAAVPRPSAPTPVRAPTNWSARSEDDGASARQRGAERRRMASVRQLFAAAEVSFPPGQLLLRGFKLERHLEVWAAEKRGGPMKPITTYGFCAASGHLGPKRREGDRQVPEGFYRLDFFHPKSRFHLSMRIDYPNGSDRVLSDPKEPGGEIMIHGGCASVGCLAMSDERIEELWVMARKSPGPVMVRLYPARDLERLLADESLAEHHAFWRNLAEGKRRFDRDHRALHPRVGSDGRYRFP